jgi:very-short-patch-repair endonuclease
MRKAMNPPEARLWLALRRLRAQGFHFRRQHPLLGYYLDFVCLSRGLAIEVDGGSHEGRSDWDRRRDAALLQVGLKTLRIPALDVRDRLPDVMDFILRQLEAAAPTRPLRGHPPRSGEGD